MISLRGTRLGSEYNPADGVVFGESVVVDDRDDEAGITNLSETDVEEEGHIVDRVQGVVFYYRLPLLNFLFLEDVPDLDIRIFKEENKQHKPL